MKKSMYLNELYYNHEYGVAMRYVMLDIVE